MQGNLLAKSKRKRYYLRMRRDTQIAVLTGDLVGSSELDGSTIKDIFRALHRASGELANWHDGGAPLARHRNEAWARHRGDGWQRYLVQPQYALRAALLFRAAVRSKGRHFDTRIAIAIGEAGEETITDPNEATGPAFVASGRALDAMRGDVRMVHASGGALGAATRLADQICQGWTAAQATAVFHALHPARSTREEIAKRIGKSRQAVDQALAAAGFRALDDALAMIEATEA